MMAVEMLRALAGIVASETMDKDVKEQAKLLMLKLIKTMDKQNEIETNMMKKASAEMNGIIS